MPVTDTIFKSLAYFQNSVTLPVCLCQRVPRYMYTLINKFTISRIIAFAVILFFFFLISILTLENFDVISLDRPYSKKYYILECFYYDLLIILFPLASLFVYFKFNRDAVCIFVFVYLNILLLGSIVFYSEPLRLVPIRDSATFHIFIILFWGTISYFFYSSYMAYVRLFFQKHKIRKKI